MKIIATIKTKMENLYSASWLNLTLGLSTRIFHFFYLFIVSVSIATASSLFPLQKGTIWIYEGRVEWQKENKIESKNIHLITEIIKVLNYSKGHIAVVRGFPAELAWYDEKPAGYSLLIVVKRNIYYLAADDRKEAFRLARKFSRNFEEQLQPARTIIFKPLLSFPCSPSAIKGYNSRRKLECYQSVHQTNPDIEKIDFARGLGIIHYYYNHFGTDSLADLELKEVRFPQKLRLRRLKTARK